jgi:hypothetical protein
MANEQTRKESFQERRDVVQEKQLEHKNLEQEHKNQEQGKQSEHKDPTDTRKKNTKYLNIQLNNGSIEQVEYHPAPRHHATESVTRLNQRAREQSKSSDKHVMPKAASGDMPFEWQPIGSGLASLADTKWPEHTDDEERMDNHIYDLLTLNRDIVRTDTDIPSPNTLVRVPK